MRATVNPNYPNRIELNLDSILGPLQSSVLGAFNPLRDLEVYEDGAPVTLWSYSYDVGSNRYLMFIDHALDMNGVIQVIHHMPNPPFTGGAEGVSTSEAYGFNTGGFGVEPFGE
jgi:hypothetical protein